MKISRSMKSGCALALAALLALPCINLMQARAAGPIIQDQDCTLTVSVPENMTDLGSDASAADFDKMTIPVDLYKVADVDVSGVFTSTETFSDIDYNVVMDPETNAATWSNLATETGEALKDSDEEPFEHGEIAGGNSAVIDGLKPGMYLVVPQDTFNADATVKYVLTPYLTALPSSDYTLGMGSDDTWEYERTIFLKGEAEPQFGKLTIQKTLENYNETLGPMTCVFQIDGRKTDDPQGDVVYSNVVSITLSGAGTESTTIENIPAGLKVTVTEVYEGASYEVADGSVRDNITIVSDAGVEAGQAQASASFRNQYNGGNRGGYGVTNEFTVLEDGNWGWTDPTSPNTPPAN